MTVFKKDSYLPEIDGVRAVAVLSVMIFHLKGTLLPGGFVGVDVFFVLSGYVVAKAIHARPWVSLLDYVLGFYARRMVRIAPALLICLMVSSLATVLFVPASWLSTAVNRTGLAAFWGLSNVALLVFTDGYFSPRIEFNSFAHTWSLSVEEQFYVIFPVLFWGWLKFRHQADAKGIVFRGVIPGLALVSLCLASWQSSHQPEQAYYLLASRFWELAGGAVLYQCHATGRCLPRSKLSALLALAGGLLLVAVGMAWAKSSEFPFPWALMPVVGTLLMMAGVAHAPFNNSWLHQLFRHPVMLSLGKASYSLYLWHWPVYTLMRWTTGLETAPYMLAALTITFLLAWVSFHRVEVTVRTSAHLASWTNTTKVTLGLTLIAICFCGAGLLFFQRDRLSLSVTRDTYAWYPYAHAVQTTGISSKPYVGRRLFVVGNSHAGAYATMLHEAEVRLGLSAHIYQLGECALVNLTETMNPSEACQISVAEVLTRIERLAQPDDIVFFASLRSPRLSDQWKRLDQDAVLADNMSQQAIHTREVALAEATIVIQRLQAKQLKVLIDAPKPVFKAPAFRCSDWFNRNNPICQDGFDVPKTVLVTLNAPIQQSLEQLVKRFSNVTVWDPLPSLCPGAVCSAFDHGQPLFFDGDHLSGHGGRVLYPAFETVLASVWSDVPSLPVVVR